VKKITMTLSSADVTLSAGRGSLTASVTNASATPERVVLGAFTAGSALPSAAAQASASAPASVPASAPAGPAPANPDAEVATKPTWTTIDRPLRTIGAGATEQYEVSFDTTGADPGTYQVKLLPYSADEAPEDYADLGVVVRLVVPAEKVVPPPPKRFPWWIAVLAAVVVLLGAGVWIFLATRGPDLALTSFSPSSGPATGGTEVHIVGRFTDPTVVSLGDTRVKATRVSDEEYVFATPPVTETGQKALRVQSHGKSLGVVVFDYQAVLPTPPTAPLRVDLQDVFIGQAFGIHWEPYTCPVGPALSGYEIRIDPGIAFFVDANPTSPATTDGTVVPQNFGPFTVSYQALCGPNASGFSPPQTVFVRPPF
jgi:hypothetical protein